MNRYPRPNLWLILGMRNDDRMRQQSTTRQPRRTRRSLSTTTFGTLVAIAALAVAATPAVAAFGDHFGIAPINDGAGLAPEVPALPGDSHAFWAGTCDLGAAPASGSDLTALGGIGAMPTTVQAAPGDNGRPGFDPVYPQVPAPEVPGSCIDWGEMPNALTHTLWTSPPAWRLPAVDAAGAHADGSTMFWFHREVGQSEPDGAVDNIYVDLPPGFVADPNAVPKCTAEQFAVKPLQCPPETQVGVLRLYLHGAGGLGAGNYNGAQNDETVRPVFNLEPREGNVAELGLAYLGNAAGAGGNGFITARIVAKARTSGDFGVTGFTGQIPVALPLFSQAITLWGVPWERGNDVWRMPQGIMDNGSPANASCVEIVPGTNDLVGGLYQWSGLKPACRVPYDPSWGPMKPFVSLETDCNPSPVTGLAVDSYQHPGGFTAERDPDPTDGDWKRYVSPADPVIDCSTLDFGPDIGFGATSSSADGASGLNVDLRIPQKNVPPFATPAAGASQAAIDGYVADSGAYWNSDAGRAVAHLKDTVVTLPEGLSVNPSTATGLQACSDAQIGLRQLGSPPLFNNGDPFDGSGAVECPRASVIGSVEVATPLLDETLTGQVVLGEPKSTDPTSGEMLRMFLVVRNPERGLLAKVYGSATADPATGRITARFLNNPELPFDDLSLRFKDGPKGVLGLPQRCGGHGWSTAFTPWSSVGAPTPVADVQDGGSIAVDQSCANAFAPGLAAGMDTQAARDSGTFSFRFTRAEGDQYLRRLTATLPKGLLASVRDLPLCSNAAADAGACPQASKIGIVDAKAGSGDPFVLEEKGEVFLTDGYKGGAYGLAVTIRPIAGPFRGNMELSPIVVRQAIHVDRKTAQVTAVSDPFPLIHHGVPLRVREVTVLVNRGNFMLNPSDCDPKQVAADLLSDQAAHASTSNAFQAARCASLAFKPKLTLALTGRKQVRTGKHPGIRAVVTQQGVPEAGIEKAEVRLPKSLALDVDNAQALCEFKDGTKTDLENHCPKGSIVGRARAVSPLLNDPLAGNVYFVKNVRRSASGNLIRTLPMIVVALRGEIAINLVGESNVSNGKLVNTFDQVPDAPITRFNLNIQGGRNGIIAVTRTRRALINLCASGRQIAEADIDGHNGRRHDRDIRMKTPCTKAAKRKAKRAAVRRAAAKHPAAADPRH